MTIVLMLEVSITNGIIIGFQCAGTSMNVWTVPVERYLELDASHIHHRIRDLSIQKLYVQCDC